MIMCQQSIPLSVLKSGALLRSKASHQQGLTLVELMVAMAISLLITLAAAGVLVVSRQGFTSVDASSQLRDNGRFTADLLQRLGGQTGYKSAKFVMDEAIEYDGAAVQVAGKSVDPESSVMGVNNATWKKGEDFDWGKSAASVSGSSDVLVFRFLTSIEFEDSTGKKYSGMINCAGNPIDADDPFDRNDRAISVLYVAISTGEPALMCASGSLEKGEPLIEGVENFQVLYGVDRVTPNAVTVANPDKDDGVPDRYLRANQITVSGNTEATNANWRRVRSIRVGMVVRGAVGSAVDRTAQTFYPFGKAKASSAGAEGSAFASSDDPGTIFKPTPDGRLRQVVTFTIHLRNDQKNGFNQ